MFTQLNNYSWYRM